MAANRAATAQVARSGPRTAPCVAVGPGAVILGWRHPRPSSMIAVSVPGTVLCPAVGPEVVIMGSARARGLGGGAASVGDHRFGAVDGAICRCQARSGDLGLA